MRFGSAAASIGDPECEPLLIRALERAGNATRKQVVEALAHVGSTRAIEALRATAAATADLRRDAEIAIVAIKARLQGAEPGQLELADDAGGAVSIAADGGEVSLALRATKAGSGTTRT